MAQSTPSEVPIFSVGGMGGGVFCIHEKFQSGQRMGILCELRREVPKCTMIISNLGRGGGGILVCSFQVPHEKLEGWVYSRPEYPILLTFSSHWAKLSITDSLSHTTCVEINNGYCSSLDSHLLFIEICFVAKIINITLTYSKHVKIKSTVAFFLWLEVYTLYVTLYFQDHDPWTNPRGHRLHAMDVSKSYQVQGGRTLLCAMHGIQEVEVFFYGNKCAESQIAC